MKRHGSMPLDKIIDLTYHLAHKYQTICPFHMQEPMLEPRLDKICSNVKVFNPKSNVIVYTNFSVYPEKQLQNIVKWGLIDNLIVSLYGGTPELHNKLQKGVDYETVKANVLRFKALRDKAGYETPHLIIGYLVTEETYSHILDFKREWEPIADTLTFFRYDSWCGTQPYDAEYERKVWGEPAPRVPCKELWAGPTIHFDGTLVPCCLDHNNSMPMGNIFENWNQWLVGREINDLRAMHIQGRYDEIPLCKNCTKWRYNHEKEWINLWLQKLNPLLVPSAANQ
jgi:hypothetical protein